MEDIITAVLVISFVYIFGFIMSKKFKKEVR